MRKFFITGLVILLPLAVTIAVVAFLMNFLTEPFIGFVESFLQTVQWQGKQLSDVVPVKMIHLIAQISILVALFLFTLILGFFARWFFVHSLLKFSDRILHRIPLVNKIYKTTQEIIQTFFRKDSNSFKRVVIVPFPNKDVYCLGLVSRDAPEKIQNLTGNSLISVFIPTTPNPTSGFILMFKNEDVIDLDIKAEDALKFIVSCGVIHPESLQIPQQES